MTQEELYQKPFLASVKDFILLIIVAQLLSLAGFVLVLQDIGADVKFKMYLGYLKIKNSLNSLIKKGK